ncbi:MAG: polysaccharide deacetylase family protein [Nitrospiraceae bacterium]|nr:polysaccharide deacetylase family protein [Nitrospiraceae bacterium]
MITVKISDKFIQEKKYIIDVLLSDFIGLDFKILSAPGNCDYEVVLENGNSLLIRDIFFSRFKDGQDYLSFNEIPDKVDFIKNQFIPGENIPVIFGTGELTLKQNNITCGIDVFASSFFMLARWEEYANKKRDAHNRFPANESLAYKNGFLNRAVVNEYVEMLWNMLCKLNCAQSRKKRAFRVCATHDVDSPFRYAGKSAAVAIKQFGGDLVKRKNPGAAVYNFNLWARTTMVDAKKDPYNTFDSIMDFSDRAGIHSTFLFIAEAAWPEFDGNYCVSDKLPRKLLSGIVKRGHEIGLHLSYGSFDDPAQTKREFDKLKTVCFEQGIRQKQWLCRQHYLRWDTPQTFANIDGAGVDYDSTLSFANSAGFRCGVCYEFPVFNILTRERLRLRERPLLVMECTVIDQRYMGLGAGEEAFLYIKSIKDICRRFKGDFVILWHNTRFIDMQELRLYAQILQA